jgi:hypothetical protein
VVPVVPAVVTEYSLSVGTVGVTLVLRANAVLGNHTKYGSMSVLEVIDHEPGVIAPLFALEPASSSPTASVPFGKLAAARISASDNAL